MRIAITGATGFLGGFVCERLLRSHDVVGLGRNPVAGRRLAASGASFVPCDLRDANAVSRAIRDVDLVVHCAARSTAWGRRRDFEADNVHATRHVVEACLAHNVARLVHISSPSIYSTLRDRTDVRESDALPRRSLNEYAATKRSAEEVVDAAVCERGLAAVTLRPQALFGPGDPSILPRFVALSRSGGIPVFDDRSPLVDVTYVGNAAQAVELALSAGQRCVGRHYNITNGEPRRLIELLSRLFEGMGEPLRIRRLPWPVAWAAAPVLEYGHRLLRPDVEPALTRYKLSVLACSRTLNIEAAKHDLLYSPEVTLDEGIGRYAAWWRGPGA